MLVQLKFASLPAPLGLLAVHFWFTIEDPRSGRCDRWEVWQRPDAGGRSVGHLHCNLKAPDAGVGGGPARLAREWRGEPGLRIAQVLEKSAEQYPFCRRYLPWPGPNSNTFAAWVLRRAGIDYRLPWKAIGRRFACPGA
jgi:hypothetical protein